MLGIFHDWSHWHGDDWNDSRLISSSGFIAVVFFHCVLMVEGDVAPRVTTKANLCSFLPFFLYYARTKQGKKEKNNNNQFQQIKPNPCLSSHFRCCFSMQRVFIHYRTNVARAMHLSTTGFNALIGFGNCPGGTWKGHSTKSSQFGEGKT